jgi:hypothetical protein
MLRQLRAALSIGIIWALVWLPIGAAVALYAASEPPRPSDLLHRPVDFGVFLSVWTVWGGLSGTGFSLILAATERRRRLADLSRARTALWGGLGSMSVPAVLTALDWARGSLASSLYDWRPPVVSLLASAALGAACAAATLAFARRPAR